MTERDAPTGMWVGEGWIRTRRQLGLVGFILAAVIDTATGLAVPIVIYGVLTGLLGLDVLSSALTKAQEETR